MRSNPWVVVPTNLTVQKTEFFLLESPGLGIIGLIQNHLNNYVMCFQKNQKKIYVYICFNSMVEKIVEFKNL